MRHLALLPVATAITLIVGRTLMIIGAAAVPTPATAALAPIQAPAPARVVAPSPVAAAQVASGVARVAPDAPARAALPLETSRPSVLPVERVAPPRRPPESRWVPPAWLTGTLAPALPALDGAPVHTSGPSIRARSAIIADLDRGEVLWARRPDASAPVASLTKLASALTLVSLDRTSLDRELCITPEQWPVRPGAHSRFETGACHTGWELFGAALVHSDNRGAMAMPALVGLSMDDFVQHMNLVSRDLGARAEWADPSGLDDGNNASARDMLKLVVAAASAPDVALAASARSWTLDRDHGARVVGTTNRTIDAWETLAAKTGYTDTAKYCFTTVIRTSSGRTLALALLGAPSDDGRFADARALVAWAEQVDAAADGVADAR